MTAIKPEIVTQKRIIKMFEDPNLLGYVKLGDWKDRENNSNVEIEYLEKFLKDKYDPILIKKAIQRIQKVTTNPTKNLYDINKEFYNMLRYGVREREDVGEDKDTVWLIDWENPKNNHFYIAEEVSITGENTKRPDIVLYVNGIALVVLELKSSRVSIGNGIRQNLGNQKSIFIKNFFATIQLVMAGSDSEGLQYGVIETPEKYYLTWKEDTPMKELLHSQLYAMCQKERLLDIIHNFIVFDGGTKKICRHNQYFGAKATQESLRKEEGGIIWHTQGSGKSLLMIWLAKWIREKRSDARVLILTDRQELDEQIEKFFNGVNEKIIKTTNGKDLIEKLDETTPWLMCSLIHKFRENNDSEYDDYVKEVLDNLKNEFKPKGNLHIFIDECHRTQSGKLHDAMKKLLPNAIILGFTGTPLLKKDKKTTVEKFGKYIHKYKYDEAVEDGVVLDLVYEAREIEQNITSPQKIDTLLDTYTKGLTTFGKNEVKKKWGTMQKIFSSKSRLEKIVHDIIYDMTIEPRLANGRGNAILVVGSIYQACRYYEIFQENNFKKCAVITSYDGSVNSIKGETVSPEEETEAEEKLEIYNKMLADYDNIGIGKNDPEKFEKQVKEIFIKKPNDMKLLIVVNKLLTGFDAPSASFLYLDKSLKDHGLFQAICRVNRLDGVDKEYGCIIDYKDLFHSIEHAVTDYTSDAFEGYDHDDVKGLLKNRIRAGRENLDTAINALQTLCDPVKPPKDLFDYFEYFCGSRNELDDTKKLKETSPRRFQFYDSTSSLVRAYANLANSMEEAGYDQNEFIKIKKMVKEFQGIKESIKLRSGESIDLKRFEPQMRHLIDNYIDAEESRKVSSFGDLTLVDLVIKSGISTMINNLPEKTRKNQTISAETVESNVRKTLSKERPKDPEFFDKMSILLDELILERKKDASKYEKYLKDIEKLCKEIGNHFADEKFPKNINTKLRKVLYNNLENNENLVVKLDESILKNKPEGWKGNMIKEKMVKQIIEETLKQENIDDPDLVQKILDLAINQDEY
ncbi:HsdR family type I site-specific deoxyribonuclease [Nitrosopumilus sp.]|nr:HsdR family type I site-specific deoxyribonuclease [Nitrosopumilus sp.]